VTGRAGLTKLARADQGREAHCSAGSQGLDANSIAAMRGRLGSDPNRSIATVDEVVDVGKR
jgi:hypothetical protein